jgi:hypothetical protein
MAELNIPALVALLQSGKMDKVEDLHGWTSEIISVLNAGKIFIPGLDQARSYESSCTPRIDGVGEYRLFVDTALPCSIEAIGGDKPLWTYMTNSIQGTVPARFYVIPD